MLELIVADEAAEAHRLGLTKAWVQAGVVAGAAFVPRPKDVGRLSCTGKGKSAVDALRDWHARFTSRPVHVFTVTGRNCATAGTQVVDDSGSTGHHVFIDFRGWDHRDVIEAADYLAEACSVTEMDD